MPTSEKTFLCSVCTAVLLTVSAATAGASGAAQCGGLETVLAGPPPEPRPTASIAGWVIDEQGVPIKGVSLSAMLVGFAPGCGGDFPLGTWVNASTGVDGRFVLAPLRPDLFEIRVAGPDLQSTVVRQRVGNRQHLEGLEIVLPKVEIAFLEGRVVGANGAPVAGAQIFGSHVGGADTDSDGRFRMKKCRTGRHQLKVSHPEQGWTTVDVEARAGVNRLDIRLPRSTQVRGRIVLPDGTPLTRDLGFDVSAHFIEEPGRISVDDQGEFRIGVPPGEHEIRLYVQGWLHNPPLPDWPEVRVAFEATEKPLELKIRLSEGSTISGHVSGLLPGETATVEITKPFLWPPKSAWIKQDGPYQLDRLPPGTLTLKAKTQHRSLDQIVEVGTETSLQVDFVFDPADPGSGRVGDAGPPAEE